MLIDSTKPRACYAGQRWSAREQQTAEQFLPISAGIELSELRLLANTGEAASEQELRDWFEIRPESHSELHPSELLMAARMTAASVGVMQQRNLLQAIKAIPRVATPELDAHEEQAAWSVQPEAPPYQQGYQLAQWLRQQLNISNEQPVVPEKILRLWGIHLTEVDIAAGIDAAAVWGDRHGPAVLVNINPQSRASTANGRRSTFAHEICHMLVDRSHALPVGEVLGGQVPRSTEQRANAFAAELLMPREQVERVCRAASDLLVAASSLEETFRVSRQLTLHQIKNSELGPALAKPERQRLERWAL